MENIIKIAIEGGYASPETLDHSEECLAVTDANFWQALQVSCKWEKVRFPPQKAWSSKTWLLHAQNFHHINLVEGWDAAVSYLTSLLTPSSTREGEMK